MRPIYALAAAAAVFLSVNQLWYLYRWPRPKTNHHAVALPLINNVGVTRKDSRRPIVEGTQQEHHAALSSTHTAIFYNVYSSPRGNTSHTLQIVNEQLETWRRSGIALNATLFYALLGKDIHMPCTSEETCIRLDNINREGGEEETLQALYDYCLAHFQDTVVYMHTKGSFHDNPQNTVLRRLLTNAIFSNACLAFGNDDECDICSARFSPIPHWHTPGNMWVAKCAHVRKLLAPKKFAEIDSHVIDEAKKTFHWGPPKHPAHIGQDRYANEHWVHTHPQLKPCDVYTGNYAWGYTLDLNTIGPFQRACAPRFPREKYRQMDHNSANWTDLGYRLFEMYLLYQHVPPESSWVWDFYMQDNNNAKGLIELQQWNATVWNSAPSQYQLLVQQENADNSKHQKEVKVPPIVETTIASSNVQSRNGVIVLGMHRSGTSMISGLLVEGCGYNVGGPLIEPHKTNPKGFFELLPAVLQNDEFMRKQNVKWNNRVEKYDNGKAKQQYENGEVDFEQGKNVLEVLNNGTLVPYLQKDPRMCITLPTWLKLLNNEPAVLFTYRHPLEVAMSLKKRQNDFGLGRALRLWIAYNMLAIQNSQGLCRVLTSNNAVLRDPLSEVQRISDELTNRCGVAKPPHRLTQDKVSEFVKPELQQQNMKDKKEMAEKEVIAVYNGCKVYGYDSPFDDGHQNEREMESYKAAMKIYCDMENGKAFDMDYKWPKL